MATRKLILVAVVLIVNFGGGLMEEVSDSESKSKPSIVLPLPVPPKVAPYCQTENEVYFSCGGPCDNYCAFLNEPCTIQNIQCPAACYCRQGYARDKHLRCIPISQCPKNNKPTQCDS